MFSLSASKPASNNLSIKKRRRNKEFSKVDLNFHEMHNFSSFGFEKRGKDYKVRQYCLKEKIM